MSTPSFPPIPNDPLGENHAWREWLRRLQILVITKANFLFTGLDFTGSNLTSLTTRNHNDLQNIQGGSAGNYHHLKAFTASISSGFGSSPSVLNASDSLSFQVNVGTGGVASNGVIGMSPAATTGWNVQVQVLSPTAAQLLCTTYVNATTTTTIGLINATTSTGVQTAWPASTVLMITAVPY